MAETYLSLARPIRLRSNRSNCVEYGETSVFRPTLIEESMAVFLHKAVAGPGWGVKVGVLEAPPLFPVKK